MNAKRKLSNAFKTTIIICCLIGILSNILTTSSIPTILSFYTLQSNIVVLTFYFVCKVVALFKDDFEECLPYAVAIEMVHNFSLIHDDLPALDNDDLRRGKKTNHIVYGEDIAILAGDALLNYAFETMLSTSLEKDNPKKYLRAIHEIGKSVGIYGMIGGQVVDVKNVGNPVSKEVLDFIYELKTSALIESSMMIGAVLADASDEDVQKIERIAKGVGIAFQIQDDILDVTSTAEVLGKPILSDEKNDKTTYVTLIGLEKAKEQVEQISMEAIELLHQFKPEDSFLEELLTSLIHREK